jgi:hypothetical protein
MEFEKLRPKVRAAVNWGCGVCLKAHNTMNGRRFEKATGGEDSRWGC